MNAARWCLGTIALGSVLAFAGPAQADEAAFEVPTTSPSAVVRQTIASTEVEVRYQRPSMRGRAVFGALVPYGQVWRTGADSATQISFSTPVSVEGSRLEAGTYELFTIPGEREWTVILQPSRSQWGSYSYDPANDAARITVEAAAVHEPVESLSIGFDRLAGAAATMQIAWDRVRVPVRITVDVRETVLPRLEAALAAEGRKPYFRAAMFYFENDLDIDRAAELMAKALETNEGHVGMLYRQALILERKGDKAGAIAAAEASLTSARAASGELQNEYIRLDTELLERLR